VCFSDDFFASRPINHLYSSIQGIAANVQGVEHVTIHLRAPLATDAHVATVYLTADRSIDSQMPLHADSAAADCIGALSNQSPSLRIAWPLVDRAPMPLFTIRVKVAASDDSSSSSSVPPEPASSSAASAALRLPRHELLVVAAPRSVCARVRVDSATTFASVRDRVAQHLLPHAVLEAAATMHSTLHAGGAGSSGAAQSSQSSQSHAHLQPQPQSQFGLAFPLGNPFHQALSSGPAASHPAAHTSAHVGASTSAHAGASVGADRVAQWQMSDLDGSACADDTAVLPHVQRHNVPLVLFLSPLPHSAMPPSGSAATHNSAAYPQFQPPAVALAQHPPHQHQQQYQQPQSSMLFPPSQLVATASPPHAHGIHSNRPQAGRPLSPSPSLFNSNGSSKQPRGM
jgi:hypothetical protein